MSLIDRKRTPLSIGYFIYNYYIYWNESKVKCFGNSSGVVGYSNRILNPSFRSLFILRSHNIISGLTTITEYIHYTIINQNMSMVCLAPGVVEVIPNKKRMLSKRI